MIPYARNFTLLLIALIALLISPSNTTQAIIEIPTSSPAFIQTTGPNAGLSIGDYRTHATGDNLPHIIGINLPCVANLRYDFELFDPAIDIALNAPGIGLDGVTQRVSDEPRSAPNTATTNVAEFDTTSFQLLTPANVVLANVTYPPNTSDAAWTSLGSVTLPPAPVFGVDCGQYSIQASTSDDDDNSWRFRLLASSGGIPFDAENGADGVTGTGDEAAVSVKSVSYQHLPGTCPGNDQTFYWFSGDGNTNMYMVNFDLDNVASVTYRSPSGDIIAGTISGLTLWNNTPPQQVNRPTFANMSLFDPTVGDLTGDAIAAPESGLWSATICVNDANQYSFEVPDQSLFLSLPEIPEVVINKDDGLTVVNSPGSTTYTLTITNTGTGAALPIAGPEVVDILPAGMSFVSCTVNPPLVGSCGNVGNTVNVELSIQAGINAYLPASGLPNDSGTITIVANVDAGLADGSTLTNFAQVDWTGIFGNNYEPNTDTDIDTVNAISVPLPTPTSPPNDPNDPNDPNNPNDPNDPNDPNNPTNPGDPNDPNNPSPPTTTTTSISTISLIDPYITKSVNPPFSLPGAPVVWTITVFNPTDEPFTNVIMQDAMPSQVEILNVSSSSGTASFSGQTVYFVQPTLNGNASVTIIVNTRVRPDASIPYFATNRACFNTAEYPAWECATATVISITALPSTGQSPISPWRPLILALAGLALVSVGAYATKRLMYQRIK